MCTTALYSLFPWTQIKAPAMPTVPVSEDQPGTRKTCQCKKGYCKRREHTDHDERTDALPPALEPAGLVFETDPSAP